MGIKKLRIENYDVNLYRNIYLKTTVLVLALFLLIFTAYYFTFLHKETIKTEIGERSVTLEVVRSEEDLKQGLSGRAKMHSAKGMLFVMPEKSKTVFWNKGMLFPIDIIWLRGGDIVDIYENLLEEKYFGIISAVPEEEIDMVIELNAGFVRINNVKIGDKIKLPNDF